MIINFDLLGNFVFFCVYNVFVCNWVDGVQCVINFFFVDCGYYIYFVDDWWDCGFFCQFLVYLFGVVVGWVGFYVFDCDGFQWFVCCYWIFGFVKQFVRFCCVIYVGWNWFDCFVQFGFVYVFCVW